MTLSTVKQAGAADQNMGESSSTSSSGSQSRVGSDPEDDQLMLERSRIARLSTFEIAGMTRTELVATIRTAQIEFFRRNFGEQLEKHEHETLVRLAHLVRTAYERLTQRTHSRVSSTDRPIVIPS